jgi:hypothetical protein
MTPLVLEDIVNDIVLILEKHLGVDHDAVTPIAEDIKQVIKKRIVIDAEQ